MEQNFYDAQQEKITHQAPSMQIPEIAPQVKKPKKALWTFFGIILLCIGMAGGYLLASRQLPTNKLISLSPTPQASPTVSPTPIDTLSRETSNFPIYPDGIFFKKEIHEPCPTGTTASGLIICGTTEYAYNSHTTWSKVSEWYLNSISATGWSCSGGAGEVGRNTTNCTNGKITVGLLLDGSTRNGQTIISFYIPVTTISLTNTPLITQKMALYGLEMQTPPDWTVTEVNRRPEPTGAGAVFGHDCANYEIQDAKKILLLKLQPPCGFDEGAGSPLPENAVTVKQINATSTIVRVSNVSPEVDNYGTNYTNAVPKEMSYIPVIIYGENEKNVTLHNSLTITGNPNNKAALLKTADQIIASLKKIN